MMPVPGAHPAAAADTTSLTKAMVVLGTQP